MEHILDARTEKEKLHAALVALKYFVDHYDDVHNTLPTDIVPEARRMIKDLKKPYENTN